MLWSLLDEVDPPSPKVRRASTKAAATAKAFPFMAELSFALSGEKIEKKENDTSTCSLIML
jgi:hypothetical protein